MFVHIVFWRIRDGVDGRSKAESAAEMQRRFAELRPQIDGLTRLDLGVDLLRTDASADVALYSEFTSRAAYDAYVIHPAHQELVAYIRRLATERHVADYELPA
jgi:hypothetical protein